MILWVIHGCTTHYHWRFDDFMGYTTHYHWWLHSYTSHYHWWFEDFLGLHYPLSLLGIIIIQKLESFKGLETQVSFVVITHHADCYLLRLLPKFSASKQNWTESWWIKCIKPCFNTKAVSTSFQHQKTLHGWVHFQPFPTPQTGRPEIFATKVFTLFAVLNASTSASRVPQVLALGNELWTMGFLDPHVLSQSCEMTSVYNYIYIYNIYIVI